MHILFLTWKDIAHPAHGGAEGVMLNYARGLIAKGHTVTWFSSYFPGAKREEIIEGIHVIRRYHMHTIWIFAYLWYRDFVQKNTIDAIVDEAGGWPILSPLFEKHIPITFFIHHIGDGEFQKLGYLGTCIKWFYRWMIGVYRHTPTIAVSRSTQTELVHAFGFESENIHVIENVCDIAPLEYLDFGKKKNSILFLGRLMPIKRVQDAIRAFSVFRSRSPAFQEYVLDIVGNNQDESYLHFLEGVRDELGLGDSVRFLGYIPKETYGEYITEHKVILVPSMKEGFGLIVLEANAYGIPAIGYDVPGLRDSIVDGKNGYLVPDGDSLVLGEKLAMLLGNVDLYTKLSIQSLEHVRSLPHWEEKVNTFEKVISRKPL